MTKMQIGKWGNSLAVRLPKAVVDECGFKIGDEIDSEVFRQAAAIVDQAAVRARREAARAEIRKGRIKLPTNWKLSRDEANWRPAFDKW